MSAQLSERDREFFTGTNLGHLATVSASGRPQSTAVWLDVEGDEILVNTTAARVKTANARENPYVAISVVDTHDPYVMISVQGTVAAVTEDPDRTHIDSLSRRSTGHDFERRPGEQRVILHIRPVRIYRYNY